MLFLFYLLLMLGVGRCADDQPLEIMTIGVGDSVKLTCSRIDVGSLFWIKINTENVPQFLGGTSFPDGVDPRITTDKQPGEFALHIKKAKLSDAGIYHCMKVRHNVIFLKGVDLRVKEPVPDITTVPPTEPMPLQCSLVFNSENETRPGDQTVCLFRSAADESQPGCNHTQGGSAKDTEKSFDGPSLQNCTCSFFTNISSSDAGNYFCALAKCAETFCGNRSTADSEVKAIDSQRDRSILSLLCAALAVSLIVVVFLLYSIKKLKKQSCGCCNAAAAAPTVAATESVGHQSEQTEEDLLVYSVPTFISRKSSKAKRSDQKAEEEEEEEESIYTAVKALGMDSQS